MFSVVKKKLHNQDGAITIIGAIICLIVIIVFSAYISINKTSWATSEIQSIMDITATNTFQNVLSSKALKKEIVKLNSNDNQLYIANDNIHVSPVDPRVDKVLKDEYSKQLAKSLSSNNSVIKNYKIVKFRGNLEKSKWGINKNRPQIVIDSVVQATINNSKDWDPNNFYKIKFKNARNKDIMTDDNHDITIDVNGRSDDGEIILTIRSLSRMIYR